MLVITDVRADLAAQVAEHTKAAADLETARQNAVAEMEERQKVANKARVAEKFRRAGSESVLKLEVEAQKAATAAGLENVSRLEQEKEAAKKAAEDAAKVVVEEHATALAKVAAELAAERAAWNAMERDLKADLAQQKVDLAQQKAAHAEVVSELAAVKAAHAEQMASVRREHEAEQVALRAQSDEWREMALRIQQECDAAGPAASAGQGVVVPAEVARVERREQAASPGAEEGMRRIPPPFPERTASPELEPRSPPAPPRRPAEGVPPPVAREAGLAQGATEPVHEQLSRRDELFLAAHLARHAAELAAARRR